MLADLHLENFRSYKKSSFELSPNVNIIVGPNASGKTNLLEAVLMISKGKSYRAKDEELIQTNKEWSKVSSNLINGSSRTLKLFREKTPNKIFNIDDKEYKRLSLNSTLPVVLFEPDHLQLLSGSPEKRRVYLDDLLEQSTTGYGRLRRQYVRTLSQRNNLLKHPHFNNSQMFPWDVKLSELAGQIVRERIVLTHRLSNSLNGLYKELSKSKTTTSVEYKNQWPAESYETGFLKELESNLEIDRLKGFTSSGPHREDFVSNINKQNTQSVASRGENRTIVLALKISETEIIEKTRGTKPLLLLDDVFSELDGARRHQLIDHLKENQVLITTTDADLIIKDFTKNCKTVKLT